MRIGVMSDTHGDLTRVSAALKCMGPIDALIHLGDYCHDATVIAQDTVHRVMVVAGNCDCQPSVPNERIVELEGVRLLLAHGHTYRVKQGLLRLVYRAQELGCSAALFGHTHQPLLDRSHGVLLINPGSLSRPRNGTPSCALIELASGGIRANLISLQKG